MKNLGQVALVLFGKVQHDHEGHSAVGGHMFKEFLECGYPSGKRTHVHDAQV
ncbi:MAG TPA: hypothetical protein VIS99_04145 [Terrimicrobiaceae bacterium]